METTASPLCSSAPHARISRARCFGLVDPSAALERSAVLDSPGPKPNPRWAAAAVCFTGSLPLRSTKAIAPSSSKPRRRFLKPRVVAVTAPESSTIDYSSSIS
ncbi:hypothetical protein BHE74_00029757 [Ensete ventricosum]|nr:hypothetical protein BHE74_00029757 [Ensete ventricosum]